MFSQLRDHAILGGYGRVGRNVALELDPEGVKYIVVDMDAGRIAGTDELGVALVYHALDSPRRRLFFRCDHLRHIPSTHRSALRPPPVYPLAKHVLHPDG